jgi:hypothetical protein
MKKSIGTKKTIKKIGADDAIIHSTITKLSDLNISTEPDTVSYLDEAKKMKKCIVTMLSTADGHFLPERTTVHCWWCRHAFDTIPIGCPTRYVPYQVEKEYVSEITKDSYTIRENLDIAYSKEAVKSNDQITYRLYDKNYYEVDGIFCSFNCVLAHMYENKHIPLYKNSKHLLKKIYFDLFGKVPEDLKPAASWKLLKVFGGHLSIHDFRGKFNYVEYIDCGRIVNIQKFKPIGTLFEEKSKL